MTNWRVGAGQIPGKGYINGISIKASYGSSTSTKSQPTLAKDTLTNPLCESEDNSEMRISLPIQGENTNTKITDNISESEESEQKDDDANIDETTSKLLASGISISLIRKKKSSHYDTSNCKFLITYKLLFTYQRVL